MDRIESLLKRPRAYENIDGMVELGIGFWTLSYALFLLLGAHTPADSIWNRTYGFLIWIGLTLLVSHFGTKAIKKHITYPRTGFVTYGTPGKTWRMIVVTIVAFVVAAVVSAGVILAVRARWSVTSALPVGLFGLLFAGMYTFGFGRTVRWKRAVALFFLLGSILIAALPADLAAMLAPNSLAITGLRPETFGAFLLCMMLFGAIFLISGGITFWLYLRHTQAPTEEANEPANADVQ